MASAGIPGAVQTLATTRAGERVAVASLLRAMLLPRCLRCGLKRGLVLHIRHVNTDCVIVELPDGSELRVPSECARLVQVEPVNDRAGGARPAVRG